MAHPPCSQWSRLRHLALRNDAERELAFLCLKHVRREGGVLEHPAGSAFFPCAKLPPAGGSDRHGFTTVVDQSWFGFPARKRTLLYVCGVSPKELERFPLRLGALTTVDRLHSSQRSSTTLEFAAWLVNLARGSGTSVSLM